MIVQPLKTFRESLSRRIRSQRKRSTKRKNGNPSIAVLERLEDRTLLSGLSLVSSEFFGGAGDQTGRGIAIQNNDLYVSGTDGGNALLVKYDTGLGTPAWSDTAGGESFFNGVAATSTNIYTVGGAQPPTFGATDGVGATERKSAIVIHSPAGIQTHAHAENFFVYTGAENYNDAAVSVEGGSTFLYAAGSGEVRGFGPFAYTLAKYDESGTLIGAATDSTVGITFGSTSNPGGSSGSHAVTVLDSHVYAAGNTGWIPEGDSDFRPVIWKYDTNLNIQARFRDQTVSGQFLGMTDDSNSLYAVGTSGFSSSANGRDYLVQKYDQSGNQLWSKSFGGTGDDILFDVVHLGNRIYAVGQTDSEGAGGTDIVILEMDASNGDLLSTTLFGGAENEDARGIVTDGTDIFVTGSSRSFASSAGNTIGENDQVVLRYSPQLLLEVQIDIKPGSFPNSINLGSKGTIPIAILSTSTFDATSIDPTTVTLADAAVKVRGKGTPMASEEDVNDDGLLDLVVHVETQGLDLTDADNQAELTGETFDGVSIVGTDTIRVVAELNVASGPTEGEFVGDGLTHDSLDPVVQ